MITQTNKYADFVDSLEKKVAHYGGDRATNTPKQRKQDSSARCEAANLQAARDACQEMADALEDGSLPDHLSQKFRTMKSICEATETRVTSGTGYYSECYLDDGNYRDTSQDAVALRAWLDSRGTTETDAEKADRRDKLKLYLKLSELRGANIDGFFPTPDSVLDIMFDRIGSLQGLVVLEPSAGIGSIADRIVADGGDAVCFEVHRSLCEILEMKGHTYYPDDFLTCEAAPVFDRVLMNPPFEKDAAPKHVRHAYDFLGVGGELLAIMPGVAQSYGQSNKRTLKEFSQWLSFVPSEFAFTPLPEGSFKGAFRSTGISCVMLWILK